MSDFLNRWNANMDVTSGYRIVRWIEGDPSGERGLIPDSDIVGIAIHEARTFPHVMGSLLVSAALALPPTIFGHTLEGDAAPLDQ